MRTNDEELSSKEMRAEFKAMFEFVDQDNNGSISKDELGRERKHRTRVQPNITSRYLHSG